MKKHIGRIAALVLAMVMLVGILPAYAVESDEQYSYGEESGSILFEETDLSEETYSETNDPTDPVTDEPEDPTDPTDPATPATDEPEDPTDPADPATPATDEPEDPTAPATPETDDPTIQTPPETIEPVEPGASDPENEYPPETPAETPTEPPTEPPTDDRAEPPVVDPTDFPTVDPTEPPADDPTVTPDQDLTSSQDPAPSQDLKEETEVDPEETTQEASEKAPEEETEQTEQTEEETLLEEEIEQLSGSIADLDGLQVTLYGINSSLGQYVSIPDSLDETFQIVVPEGTTASYQVTSGKSATVNADGLISVKYTTWYWYGNMGTTNPGNPEAADAVTQDMTAGDTVIKVTTAEETSYITVHVVDYSVYYADSVLADYISNQITDSMTNYEKIEKIAQFVAYNYNYSTSASGYVGMILTGGGDCWASTSTIIHMCQMIGLEAWVRKANNDSGAGSGHRNAIVYADGIYYIVDAGFTGNKPRYYSITQKTHCFSYYRSGSNLIIYQYDGNDSSGILEIPETLDGYTVTGIDDQCFYNLNFSEIILPNTLTTIGEFAITYCSNLTRINIPASLVSIGPGFLIGDAALTEIAVDPGNNSFAFQDGVLYSKDMTKLLTAPSVSNLVIPNTVTTIGAYALRDNNAIKTIDLPASVTTIEEGAFGDCSGLYYVNASSSSLTTIGIFAFQSNSSLSNIILPATLQTVGDAAFRYCSSISAIWYGGTEEQWQQIMVGSYNTYLTDCSNIFYGQAGPEDTWSYEDGILTISGQGAMRSYGSVDSMPWAELKESITEIHIEEGITGICDYAFQGMTNLQTVSLPETLTSIGSYAFDGCSVLNAIMLPSQLTTIGDYAFSGCTSLTALTLPGQLTTIGYRAFYGCSSLLVLTVSHGVTSIPSYAFSSCNKLTDVILPTSVVEINSYAFSGCYHITNVYYAGSQSEWEAIAIASGNTCLTDARNIVYQSTGQTDTWAYQNGVLTISGSGNMKEYYSAADVPWYSYKDEIHTVIVEEGLTSLCDHAFYGMSNLQTVSLPESLRTIGASAFYNCASLTDISLPSQLTSIGNYAFQRCSGLHSLMIPSGVTAIGQYAFYYCGSLNDIILPASVETIGTGAFYYCNRIVNVYYAGSQSDWDAIAIATGNTYLTDARNIVYQSTGPADRWEYENGVLRISGTGPMREYYNSYNTPWAAYNNDIDIVIIEDGITSISSNAFTTCYGLTEITIPASVQNIPASAFYSYTSKTIWGVAGSYAETFASENNIPFRVLCVTHNLVKTEAKPKTCTENGNTAYWTCTVCEQHFADAQGNEPIILASTVIPASHEWDEGQITMDYNEIGIAVKIYTCTECGRTYNEYPLREGLLAGGQFYGLFWTINSDYHLYICGRWNIPSYFTCYYYPWYQYRQMITSLTVCEGIYSIGNQAFYGMGSLTSVTIPRSVTSIQKAFGSSTVPEVIYLGSQYQWSLINKEYDDNDGLQTATIHCMDDPDHLALEGPSELEEGEHGYLYAVYDAGVNYFITTFTSSDPSIASVDPDGNVYAWKTGQVTITAAFENTEVKDTLVLTVRAKEVDKPMDTVQISNGEATNNQDWNWYYTYANIVLSYLVEISSDTLMRVEIMSDGSVLVEYTDRQGNVTATRSIPSELVSSAGFFAGADYYYLVFTQSNPNEEADREVLRVVQYDKNWNRINACSIRDINTTYPADAGSLRMDEAGGILYIHTCHTMYMSSDGYRHQANMTFEINEANMTLKDGYSGVMNLSYGYVSHSFNQFIKVQDGYVYRVDHGDAYPRGITLTRYPVTGSMTDPESAANIYKFSGSSGANYTGASVGGFELSQSYGLIAFNNDAENAGAGYRNIYLLSVKLDQFESTELHQLTHYTAADKVKCYTPQLIKLSDWRFLVMWKEEHVDENRITVGMAITDPHGNVYGGIVYNPDLALSDCQPIVLENGTVSWYVTDDQEARYYNLDPYHLAQNEIHIIVTDPAVAPTCAHTGLTEGSHCRLCGMIVETQQVIAALPHTEVIDEGYAPTCWYYGMTNGSHCSVCGQTLVTQERIPMTSHTVVFDEGFPATCTSVGITNGYHCSECWTVIVPQEIIPPTDHQLVKQNYVAPTATTDGRIEHYRCENCGMLFQDSAGSIELYEYETIIPRGTLYGWQTIGGKTYYYNVYGQKLLNWQQIDGAWYYLGSDGARQYGWVKSGGNYYFMNRSTGKLQVGWVLDGGKYYYFSKTNGKLQVGFVKDGNAYYYFSKTDGSLQVGFVKDGNDYYYFSKTNGKLQVGFVKDGNTYYYFNKTTGKLQVGWVQDGGKYYYFDTSSGKIHTSWLQYNGKWYYFDPATGAMVTGTQVIGGKTYTFNSSGVCVG